MLPNFEYLCLNKFCNYGHVVSPKGSREWYHTLDSPNSVRQNLCTFMSSLKQWASIQSFEHNRCASTSSSIFPQNSGLKFDQLRCLCPIASWELRLFLPLSPIGCSCSFLSICHYFALYYLYAMFLLVYPSPM